jgi:predicted DNA-binding transcriptional regulator YafY
MSYFNFVYKHISNKSLQKNVSPFDSIKPHAFEQIGKSMCVKGHCYLRGADRTFSLERMSELIIDP